MTTMSVSTLLVRTHTHGRILLRAAAEPRAAGLVVGFHGYAENAAQQLERLAAIPGADAWALLAIQGLHRFYRARGEEVVASWMTREDRLEAIRDNIGYVDAAVEEAGRIAPDGPIVFVGFSQGVPMAFRSAICGCTPCAGVIAVGGEVAPELLEGRTEVFPPVLLIRGREDDWYTAARLEAEAAALRSRCPSVATHEVDGGHEWTAAAAEAAGGFLSSLLPPRP